MSEVNSINVKKLIIGITGASGSIYAIRLLKILQNIGVESHLIMTKAGGITTLHETGLSVSDVKKLASKSYNYEDISACLASGSYNTEGIVILPCSVKTMSEIAFGITNNLLSRAADVCLKERRKTVLMVRESPFHFGHLHTMSHLTQMGAIIAPPMPAFYIKPKSIEDLIDHNIGKILDLFGIDASLVQRWSGLNS